MRRGEHVGLGRLSQERIHKREKKERVRDTIIEGAIKGLKRKLTLEKCPENQRPTRMTPTNNLSNSGKSTLNVLP